ncbi:AraC family transcriptional regulator [Paenibacillus roseipurpureus]|uniref:AraC family transcriptional regulator n=1 Tax=Paenibacillus roseopurpureus TaxID=2918901 RepID=A0AA96LT94_9BACL|nr:AraC family transcriptional regulator [Paenibacillus sp. MBLB1832]WNR46106.1 AraC family transcriptional regulator [Paenibacillus sp. MBLB1832]
MQSFPIYPYKDMLDEDFPFKIEVRSPAYMNHALHAHEHLQLCYMLSGSCLHWVGEQSYILMKGDLISIPPCQEHRLEVRDSMDYVMIQVDFMPHAINESLRDLSQMQTFLDFAYIRPLIAKDNLIPKMSLNPPAQSSVEAVLNTILAEWEEQEEGFRLAIKAELLKLLVIIGRQFTRFALLQDQHEQHQVLLHRKALFQAISYMEKNFSEDLRLEDIASIALMSPSYFSYMLKLMKGKTYIELLTELRVQKAIELLRNSDLTVTEIALQVGYNHISHFNRTFKKFTHLTPGYFRKHHI